jgi:FtsZ-interacting cell division protein ZipA
MRGKGKKPAVTSHKPTQTSSNLNDGKKSNTNVKQHTKQEPSKKNLNTSKVEEPEKPASKTEKPATASKTEKPATAAKTEKPAAATKTEKPAAAPKPQAAPSSSVQSALDSKKANDEKREINKRVDALKKENIELKKEIIRI